MLKKIIAVLLCLTLVFTLCACGGNNETPSDEPANSETGNQQTNNEQPNQNSSDTSGDNKNIIDLTNAGVIICFGDSITQGMQVDKSQNYPSVLQKRLGEQIKVINAGVGGETSNTIMSRANAIEFTVTNNVVFNAGQSEAVLDWKLFSDINGGEIKYRYGSFGNELKIKNVVIDGKPYTLRIEAAEDKEEKNMKYILSRSDASAAITLEKGVKVSFDYSEFYNKSYCAVVLMGANDSDVNADELIARYKKIAATSEKFIAIIPHYGTDYTQKFVEAFGDSVVNLREYCKDKVWEDYNLKKEPKDEYYIKKNYLSAKFVYQGRKGDCHLSELGYKILGNLVYEKGVELGYWN